MTSTPVTIVGNVTDDPELRFTAGGAAVVKFSVAVNRQRYDRQSNSWEDAGTDFHRVTAWNRLAENIAATLQKGGRVIVSGDLRQDHWTDEKTGEKRSAWGVNAQAVGAELTFATAVVTKAAGRDQAAPDDPWATGTKQRPPAAAGAPAAPGAWPAGSRATDEPPF